MRSFFDDTSRRKIRQRAMVVGVFKKTSMAYPDEGQLDEIISLCRTAGARIVGRVIQYVDRYNASTLMGKGKVDELAKAIKEKEADLVVFDTILSPSQQVNLERILSRQVIDRPAVILDIFALHARTRESQTQVELAQLQYLLPRLMGGWTHLERQEGAIGTRGPGETQLETDRRLIRKRIRDLKKKLVDIEGERRIQRKRRSAMFKVCLVGYTNAGKSSIFNLLTNENVAAADYLFATLDSTTRRLKLSGRNEILLSDTVGFIKRLPVTLVASFKSTLQEASGADMLLHVIDISNDDYEERIAAVNGILRDIGCDNIPLLHIFNKIDMRNDPDLFRLILGSYPGSRFISAVTGEGIARLKDDLESYLERSNVTIVAKITPDDGAKLNLVSSIGHLLDSVSRDGVLNVTVRLPRTALGKLAGEGVIFEKLDAYHGHKG